MKKINSLLLCILLAATAGVHAQQLVSDAEMENIRHLKTDWPDLGRFREANSIAGFPAPGENRVVFMGNSITIGWIEHRPEFFKDKPYINRGISGQTTPQMLVRFRQDVVDLKPAVVVILAGINDIAGNTGPSSLKMIEDNLASMCEIATANNIRVVLCSVLPAWDFPWNQGSYPASKIRELNQWIKNYASEHQHIYLDYYSHMADERGGLRASLTYDGVHPDAEGYRVMEPLLEQAIQKALGN
jgi:lysophospholipase L1-like esterase